MRVGYILPRAKRKLASTLILNLNQFKVEESGGELAVKRERELQLVQILMRILLV
jgi:hypothetical protein